MKNRSDYIDQSGFFGLEEGVIRDIHKVRIAVVSFGKGAGAGFVSYCLADALSEGRKFGTGDELIVGKYRISSCDISDFDEGDFDFAVIVADGLPSRFHGALKYKEKLKKINREKVPLMFVLNKYCRHVSIRETEKLLDETFRHIIKIVPRELFYGAEAMMMPVYRTLEFKKYGEPFRRMAEEIVKFSL